MIELSSATAIMTYLAMTTFFLLALWGYQGCYKSRKIELLPQQLFVCEYCCCAYLDRRVRLLTRCPQCHMLNKDNPYRKG